MPLGTDVIDALDAEVQLFNNHMLRSRQGRVVNAMKVIVKLSLTGLHSLGTT